MLGGMKPGRVSEVPWRWFEEPLTNEEAAEIGIAIGGASRGLMPWCDCA